MLEDFSLTSTPKPAPVVKVAQLQDLNLEDALLTQYNNATALLELVLHDMNTPANQRAQCINAVSGILVQITKSQADLYNAERVKKLEIALVTTVKTLDKATQEVFFEAYSLALAA